MEITQLLEQLLRPVIRSRNGHQRIFGVDLHGRDVELEVGPHFLEIEAGCGAHRDKVRNRFKIKSNPVAPLPLLENEFLILNHQHYQRLFGVDKSLENHRQLGAFVNRLPSPGRRDLQPAKRIVRSLQASFHPMIDDGYSAEAPSRDVSSVGWRTGCEDRESPPLGSQEVGSSHSG